MSAIEYNNLLFKVSQRFNELNAVSCLVTWYSELFKSILQVGFEKRL